MVGECFFRPRAVLVAFSEAAAAPPSSLAGRHMSCAGAGVGACATRADDCPRQQHIHHGRSLDRSKQLLPRSLSLQPLPRGAGSLQGDLHHRLCTIETAPCDQRCPSFDRIQTPDQQDCCPMQASIHQTCLDHQPARGLLHSTRDSDLGPFLRP